MTKEEMFIRWQLPQLKGFSDVDVKAAKEIFYKDLGLFVEVENSKALKRVVGEIINKFGDMNEND